MASLHAVDYVLHTVSEGLVAMSYGYIRSICG